jgi:cytochrome bd-type quinol oxidase subunit 1
VLTGEEGEGERETLSSSSSPNNNDENNNSSRPTKGYWHMNDEEYYRYYRHASVAWYLVPIFLGIIGGVIMWLALKSEDPRKAKKGLIVAVIVHFIALAIFLAIAGFIASLGATIVPPTIMPPPIIPPA